MLSNNKFKFSYKKTFFFISIFYLLFFSINIFATEDRFFSFERCRINNNISQKTQPLSNRRKNQYKQFVFVFNKAIDKLLSEDLFIGEKLLLRASKIWPEYYGTYFLLALIYEEYAEYEKASFYYNIYLNRLKSFYLGKYIISSSLIGKVNSYYKEEYSYAYERIKSRLLKHGINLEKEKTFNVKKTGINFIIILFFICFFIILYCYVWPYIVRQQKIKNAPEGFWVCKYCGKTNPLLRLECERCKKNFVK